MRCHLVEATLFADLKELLEEQIKEAKKSNLKEKKKVRAVLKKDEKIFAAAPKCLKSVFGRLKATMLPDKTPELLPAFKADFTAPFMLLGDEGQLPAVQSWFANAKEPLVKLAGEMAEEDRAKNWCLCQMEQANKLKDSFPEIEGVTWNEEFHSLSQCPWVLNMPSKQFLSDLQSWPLPGVSCFVTMVKGTAVCVCSQLDTLEMDAKVDMPSYLRDLDASSFADDADSKKFVLQEGAVCFIPMGWWCFIAPATDDKSVPFVSAACVHAVDESFLSVLADEVKPRLFQVLQTSVLQMASDDTFGQVRPVLSKWVDTVAKPSAT